MSRQSLQFSWISRSAAIFVVAIVALSAALFTGTASAAPGGQAGYTQVFHNGTCTNDLYYFDGVNYTFVGHYVTDKMQIVVNANSFIQHCTMKLDYGPGVSSTLVLNFDGLHQTYTPGGVATIDIHA